MIWFARPNFTWAATPSCETHLQVMGSNCLITWTATYLVYEDIHEHTNHHEPTHDISKSYHKISLNHLTMAIYGTCLSYVIICYHSHRIWRTQISEAVPSCSLFQEELFVAARGGLESWTRDDLGWWNGCFPMEDLLEYHVFAINITINQ